MIREAYVDTQTARFKELLKTAYMGHHVQYFGRVNSTNTQAISWAEEGAPEGAIVIADHQTHGRGRQGRKWESDSSRNLLFSLILRPQLPPSHLGLITVISSLSVAEILQEWTGPHPVRIKWPNDILLNDKKCCGMLIETAHARAGSSNLQAIAGLGININQDSFPDDLAPTATSLLLETGQHADRLQLLANILKRFETYYNVLDEETGAIFIEKFTHKLAYLNESINLRRHNSPDMQEGIIRGITETGALQFETEKGIEVLHAGEVTTSPLLSPNPKL